MLWTGSPGNALSGALVGIVASAMGLVSLPEPAMAGLFLKLENPTVLGESFDPDHPDWIDVMGYQHVLGGKPCLQVVVQKHLDRSDPILAALAITGTIISKGTLEFTHEISDGQSAPFLRLEFTDIRIDSISLEGSESSVPQPTDALSVPEVLSLSPKSVHFVYTPFGENGLPGPTVERLITCR